MNALPLFSPEVSTHICVTLLHSLWQVAALAAAAWLVGRLWRRQSVEWTYGVHVAALLAGFAAVPVTFVLTATPKQPARVVGTSQAEPIGFAVEKPVSLPTRAVSKEPSPALQQPSIAEMQPQATEKADHQPNRVALWKLAAPWLAGFYVAGVALMVARLALGIARAERLRGRARPLDDKPIAEALDRLAGAWSMRVVPVLATAERIVVPKVVGLLRPTILLPASALSGLSAGELEMILAHELAHVRRHDMWVNLLQRLAEAALFFNPALWLLSRRISSLREYCCDELACRGAEPRGGGAHLRYAQALLRVVELSQTAGPRRVDTAALAASGRSPSELRRRVARLFGEPLREPLQLSRGGVFALAAVLVLLWAPALWPVRAETTSGNTVEGDETTYIQPGIGYGEYRIGQSTLKDILGEDTPENHQRFSERGLSFEFHGGRELRAILFGKSDFKTAEGVGPGSSIVELRTAFPNAELVVTQNDKMKFPVWVADGIQFLPDGKGRVAVVRVSAEYLDEMDETAASQPESEIKRSDRSDASESDREAMLAYAGALAAGDFATLEKTWVLQDDLEREYAQKTAERFARAKDMRVELVSLKRLSDESLFALFLMFDGPKQSGKEPSPLPMTFRRQEGQWRCASPWNLRTTVNVQNMGVEKFGRRAQIQGMIAMSFGSEKGDGDWIAVLKAQAEAFERLAGPPYDLSQYEPIAKQMKEQIEEQETALKTVESREDLWRLVLEKEGKAILPEASDFYLSFYLEASNDTPNARRLPFPGEAEPFLAEPFPCLTDDAVLKAEVVKNPNRSSPRIEVTLSEEGAKLFAEVTKQSIGKRLAIVVDGKVVSAPKIHTEITGGNAVIEGTFSLQEAEAIVERLNAYREEAREFLDNLDKEDRQPKGELPGAKAEAKPVRPTASADVTDADRVVAEARARTFGLQDVPRIAFRQIYRQAEVPGMREYGDNKLASLWKARAVEVTDDELDRNRYETLLAWDGERLLLETFSPYRSGESWRSANYWDGRQVWMGETRFNEQGKTKGVQRYPALAKRPMLVKPFFYPQWAAAGDRLLWPGQDVLAEENNVDPSLTHYRSVGTETINGVLCDTYDGPERHERIWIERATGLVKAASRYYVSDLTEKENWKVISDAAGREFDSRHDYELWLMDLTDLQEGTFEANWHALTWEKARPGNLAVFSDYGEVAPGVRWPHTVERIVVHSNHQAEYTEEFFHNVPDGTFNYSLAKIIAEQVRDFDINELAENALPEPGVKVTDLTGGPRIDYIWSDDLDEAAIERLRERKRAEEEEAARRNNATSSDSIEDASEVLTNGPKAESPTAPPAPH